MMDESKRDDYMLEILDRLARLEEKFDNSLSTQEVAEEANARSKDNQKDYEELARRMDENDDKWKTDRSEKWAMWVAVVGGLFALGAAFITTTTSF